MCLPLTLTSGGATGDRSYGTCPRGSADRTAVWQPNSGGHFRPAMACRIHLKTPQAARALLTAAVACAKPTLVQCSPPASWDHCVQCRGWPPGRGVGLYRAFKILACCYGAGSLLTSSLSTPAQLLQAGPKGGTTDGPSRTHKSRQVGRPLGMLAERLE